MPFLTLLLTFGAVDPPPPSFFSQTCTTWNATSYCASIGATVEFDLSLVIVGGYAPEDAWAFWVGFGPWDTPSPLHPTAFAFYVPFVPPPLDGWTGLSGWGATPLMSPPWKGYHLFAGSAAGPEDRWYVTGEGYSGDINGWAGWAKPNLPDGLRWAWRGETEDGGVVIDCFQNPAGGEDCLHVTPEPATWVLLLTGLLTLGLLAKRRGKPVAAAVLH